MIWKRKEECLFLRTENYVVNLHLNDCVWGWVWYVPACMYICMYEWSNVCNNLVHNLNNSRKELNFILISQLKANSQKLKNYCQKLTNKSVFLTVLLHEKKKQISNTAIHKGSLQFSKLFMKLNFNGYFLDVLKILFKIHNFLP